MVVIVVGPIGIETGRCELNELVGQLLPVLDPVVGQGNDR